MIASNALLLEKWEGRLQAALYRYAIGPVLGARVWLLTAAGRDVEAAFAARTRTLLRAGRRD